MCESVDVSQRITWEKASDVSSSQRRIRAGSGHARLLPAAVGNPGKVQYLAKSEGEDRGRGRLVHRVYEE